MGTIRRKAVRAIGKHNPAEKLKDLQVPRDGKLKGEVQISKCRNGYCGKEGEELFSAYLMGGEELM